MVYRTTPQLGPDVEQVVTAHRDSDVADVGGGGGGSVADVGGHDVLPLGILFVGSHRVFVLLPPRKPDRRRPGGKV